jgi:hypothetical protein
MISQKSRKDAIVVGKISDNGKWTIAGDDRALLQNVNDVCVDISFFGDSSQFSSWHFVPCSADASWSKRIFFSVLELWP